MAKFDPKLIDTKYIYDAFKLIASTPEKEDLFIGFAKLNVELKDTGKAVPSHESDAAMRRFVGRPQSMLNGKDRFVALAEASHGSYEEFKKVADAFIEEDVAEDQ